MNHNDKMRYNYIAGLILIHYGNGEHAENIANRHCAFKFYSWRNLSIKQIDRMLHKLHMKYPDIRSEAIEELVSSDYNGLEGTYIKEDIYLPRNEAYKVAETDSVRIEKVYGVSAIPSCTWYNDHVNRENGLVNENPQINLYALTRDDYNNAHNMLLSMGYYKE